MPLSLLRISHLRNIQNIEIEPTASINLLWGGNGAGKTSILEAVYLLGRGRSFRGTEIGPLISSGKSETVVFGRLFGEDKKRDAIGVSKQLKGITQIKINGTAVNRLSTLAQTLPLQVLTPKSHEILERGSAYRRRFIDWGVFHVEHGIINLANDYAKALKQRNAALRRSPQTAFAWDYILIENGTQIESIRRRYLEKLTPIFSKKIEKLIGRGDVTINYRRGWSENESYAESIKRREKDDLNRGFTGTGPHRADIKVEIAGLPVEKVVSRGEQKLIIAALYLAQAKIASTESRIKPLLLIDDLPAELDKEKRALFLNELTDLNLQVFITGIERDCFSAIEPSSVFHVKHGRVYLEN
ncbi:MAG: DNA replication/repair protein RecF [Candidatus Polarisedimenticolaceae bacterium]|nr:DNA replication/repair protein RecF [Candidatus Polarisedimenticolaceae bacterium]